MERFRIVTLACVLLFGALPAVAQDGVRLQFELVKDSRTVASPAVAVASGAVGTLNVDGIGRIAFTPTLRGDDAVSVSFDIASGRAHLRPRVLIGAKDPGVISWQSDSRSELFTLRVSWVR